MMLWTRLSHHRGEPLVALCSSCCVRRSPNRRPRPRSSNGRVVDAQGGVLPGVTVTARNEATGYVRTAVTNDEGLFTLPLLPPGTYEVSMELAGFATGQRRTTAHGRRLGHHQPGAAAHRRRRDRAGVGGARRWSRRTTSIRTSTVGSRRHREPADQRPPLPGLRHPDAHRAGRHLARPAVVRRPARHQLQRQHRRRRLQPAVLRRPARRRAQQQRLHRAPGRRAGVPGRGRRLLRRVRPLHGRSRQRHHQVGHQPAGRDRRSTSTATAIWPTRMPSARSPRRPSSSSAAGSAARSSAIACSSSAPTNSRSSRTSAPSPSTSPASRRTADNAEAFDYYRSLEDDFEATNDAIALLGKVDYQWPAGSRVSVRYSYSTNEAQNSNATGNALEATTTSALSNNGTEKNGTNTVVGQFTTALRSQPAVRRPRGQYSRERRPREANEESPTVQNAGRQLRHGQLPADDAVRLARCRARPTSRSSLARTR